ncbi:hypothetical protein ACU5DF_00600 [Aliivibrio wodanis]|uniref:hypothetical protein n=1 Tax=Aliivibrio wodanis TaxID=80852 RepID=UPI00406D10B8
MNREIEDQKLKVKIEEVKSLIEENNIDEIKKIINSESVIRKLINTNDTGIIKFICNSLITDDITENVVDNTTESIIDKLHDMALDSSISSGINEASKHILSKIFNHPKKNDLDLELEFTDSEHIYYMCKGENVEFIKLLHEAEIESDWDLIFVYSCTFGQKDMVDYIMNNFELPNETINESLEGVITSERFGPFSDDPDQIYIISKLIKSNKVDVNIGSEEWNYLYFDCLICAPAAAKYFYTPEFESGCINSENFWEELLDDVDTDDEKSLYMDVLVDLKNSDVNTDGLISIFKKLNQPDLVTILSNDQSQ